MPAGSSGTDRRFPEMLAGLRRFPQREIARALFFVAVVVHASAGLNPGHIDLRQFAVVWKFRDAVVDRSFARIGVRLLLQPLDQLDHVVDVVGGANPVLGGFDAQRFAIVEKSLHIFLRVVANARRRPPRPWR